MNPIAILHNSKGPPDPFYDIFGPQITIGPKKFQSWLKVWYTCRIHICYLFSERHVQAWFCPCLHWRCNYQQRCLLSNLGPHGAPAFWTPLEEPIGGSHRGAPIGPKGPQYKIFLSFRSYFGSGKASFRCKNAIGFIWTKFQVKWSIPGPVWTHFSFWDFWDPA